MICKIYTECKFQHSQRFLGIRQPSPLAHIISAELGKRRLLDSRKPICPRQVGMARPLEHSQGHSFISCNGCSQTPKAEWSKMAEAIWSTKPKIFTIWPFTEKVCWPHIKIEEEWITYLIKQENMTVINIIMRMLTTPIHFLHWRSINFKNLNEIVLLPCSWSFNGFSSHWEQNPRIPYLPHRQTSSPALPLARSMAHPPYLPCRQTSSPVLPLARSMAHPPACWASNVPSVLLSQDICTCCFLSRTCPPTCAHFTPSPILVAAQSCHFSEAFPPLF